MTYVPTRYWVRVEVPEVEGSVNAYTAALDLALKMAEIQPGLTIEIAEDKVWSTITMKE